MTAPIPTLPPRFVVNGYTIISAEEVGSNYVLYEALSPKGVKVKLREFCPSLISSRQASTFAIEFHSVTQDEMNQYKTAFDLQFKKPSSQEFQANGTNFIVEGTPLAMGAPARTFAPIKKPKNKSSIGVAPLVIVGLFAGLGYIIYTQFNQEAPPIVEKPKQEAPKPIAKQKPVVPKVVPVVDIPEVVVDNTPEPTPEIEEEPEPVAPTYEPSPQLLALKEQAIKEMKKCTTGITKRATDYYMLYAEKAVREYITQRGGSLPKEFEDWLKKTGNAREVFGSIYPPDPSVATNVAMLVSEFGKKAEQYDQLILAIAVARREFGMGSFDIGRQGRFGDGRGALNGFRNSETIPKPCDLYIQGKEPIHYYGPSPSMVNEEIYKKVEKYLTDNKLTPSQVWKDSRKAIYAISDETITKRGDLVNYFYEYMHRNDMLKRKRDPYPTPAEFFEFLTDKYENYKKLKTADNKKVSWPGVALDVTPWPVMMALAETRPIREAEGVWSRYLGYGKDKVDFPTVRRIEYGHYRRDDDKEAPIDFSFDPDGEWSRESFERLVHCGGVCGTMSLIARTTQISLGVPGAPAGQPGHGNLMTTVYDGNGFRLNIGHSVDTLKVTTGPWYFDDSKAPRTGNAEYPSGLALSMNMKYEQFIHSRVALNAFKLYSEDNSSDKDANQRILTKIADINPYAAEVWHMKYSLTDKDYFATMTLIDQLRKTIPNHNAVGKYFQKKPYHREVGKAGKNAKDIFKGQSNEYVNVIAAAWIEDALKTTPTFDTIKWGNVRKWFNTEKDNNSYPCSIEGYQTAYIKERGTESVKADVTREFKRLVEQNEEKKGKRKRRDPKGPVNQSEMAINLIALSKALPANEMADWLKEFIDTIPDNLKFKPKNPIENKIHDFYDELTKQYFKVASSSEAARVKADMKRVDKELMDKLKETTYKHVAERN